MRKALPTGNLIYVLLQATRPRKKPMISASKKRERENGKKLLLIFKVFFGAGVRACVRVTLAPVKSNVSKSGEREGVGERRDLWSHRREWPAKGTPMMVRTAGSKSDRVLSGTFREMMLKFPFANKGGILLWGTMKETIWGTGA